MKKTVKKTVITLACTAALALSLTGCGRPRAAETAAPAAEPSVTAEVQLPAEGSTVSPEAAAAPARQNGERFETVIMLEGMEETVQYEHIKNDSLGLEMDYDYESFRRYSTAERERFVSVWDHAENPENYLDVIYCPEDAETISARISGELSATYDIITESYMLDRAGSCTRIEASVLKGTNTMAQQLQQVYIIPASDGCRVATAHFAIEAAEGFGRRFSYMMKTLSVTGRSGGQTLSDEQALAAIRKYCIANNPDLDNPAGEFPVYWELASSDAREIVVLFRSYTGAQNRYYIDRVTGDAYVTEFVPGITPEETRTAESLNVRDYLP